jgi:translocation and assembly module TamA
VQRVKESLRPYGYYQATVNLSVEGEPGAQRRIVIDVDQGPPVRVASVDIQLNGPGANREGVQRWRQDWPLPEGSVLNQSLWEGAKQDLLDQLDYAGYIEAAFTVRRIELDLDSNEARLTLVLETGPRAVMGVVNFDQDIVRPELLEALARFKEGQPYDGWLIEKFRYDLWKTGFYSTIDVVEEHVTDVDPPVVNLNAKLVERNRDTWQSSLGFGSDTEIRAQLNWTRHWLSDRGDSLGMGLGWQQRDDRYLFRTNYRLPREASYRSYWIAESLYREGDQDLDVSPENQPDDVFNLASGKLEHYLLKAGMLNIRDISDGYEQVSETWFVQYLHENVNYPIPNVELLIGGEPFEYEKQRLFSDDNSSLSLGVEWDWPVIQGQGFGTVGHHEKAWFFTANEIWGSNHDFSQAYLSSQWNFMATERIKFLLRGEIGYSDARVDEFDLDVEGDIIPISLTELPNLYRFKAGGSQSVRGYAYESLSNNGVGSNNIITMSAEVEWEFLENWSLAAFYDVGNAFNDWGKIDLKSGAGFGVRWYSIAGPVRLDFASGLNLPGDPWRIHFTVGVPLL